MPRTPSLVLTSVLALILSLVTSTPAIAAPNDDPVGCEQVFVEACPSHASGGRPEFGPQMVGNPNDLVTVLRVGLRSTTLNATTGAVVSEMASLDHADAQVTATAGDFHMIDLSDGHQIVAASAGQVVRVALAGTAYALSVDGTAVGTFTGPIRFRASDPTNSFKVLSIRR